LCSTAREYASLGYSGFRILAIDGTKLILPAYKVFEKHFGCPPPGGGKKKSGPQASLTVLWDVGANQPVNWRLGPNRQHERVQAIELMESLKPGDLLLADRGFPSRQMLHSLLQRKIQFLMRIRCDAAGSLREVVDFAESASNDAIVSLAPRIHGIRQLDLSGITVRLLRQVLPDGSSAIFVTSLCDNRHLAAELIKLYSQRWRIETAFREMKLWHGLERFHARHVDGIAQEVCALMVFQLLSSELAARVEHHHKLTLTPSGLRAGKGQPPPLVQQLPIRFNRRIVADCVVDLLRAGAKSAAELRRVFKICLFTIWRYRQKPRPGRSFPRERKSTARGWKSKSVTKRDSLA
jgi:hypothetical protein